MKTQVIHSDRGAVTEGEIVAIGWDVHDADSVRLTIDNGHHSTSQTVDAVATKKFRLNRPGKTKFILTVERQGKLRNHTATVKVKKMKAVHATPVDDNGKRFPQWRQKLQQWTMRARYARQSLPAEKRLALRVMFFLALLTLLAGIAPKLFIIGLLIVMGYLAWFIYKR